MRYRQDRVFERLFEHGPRALALDLEGRLWAAGDELVRAFDPEGRRIAEWATERPGLALAVEASKVWVGEPGQIELFESDGRRAAVWSDGEHYGRVTSLALLPESVLVGDAASRLVHRFSRDGSYLDSLGRDHRKGGFHIPNGKLDVAVNGKGTIWVANPGMHRVERFAAGGERLGHFGRFHSRDPAGFPGCCNPTSLALTPRGRVVVAEKAAPRVKLYDPSGELLAVVAEEGFHPLAKNMALVTGPGETIYVADPMRREVRVFVPEEGAEP